MNYNYNFNLYINNILLLFFWCILINKVSYTEELALSLIYIALFIIISENVKEMIKGMMINQTLKLIFCYEQLIYLKIKMILKSLKILKILIQKKTIKNLNNIISYELKKRKNNNIKNRKKINNIRKINYIYFFLLFKAYK
jgi:multisubunit Na+/H+ antiporter MnhE subunit